MKKITTIVLIVFLVFLVSCIPLKKRSTESVRSGSHALELEFMDKAPPETVYEQTPIPLVLKIENKGFSDIIRGYIAIGVDQYIHLVSEPIITIFELGGRSVYTPEGETQYINLIANAKTLDPQSQIHSADIRATACYPYKTIATANVCVDTAIYNPQIKNKPCEVKSLKFSGGQGAPVGITKVDTNMIPLQDNTLRPEFIIYIDNLAKGVIVDSSKVLDACQGVTFGESFYNLVRAYVRLSDDVLTCDSEIQIRKGGDNFIRCTGQPLDTFRGTYPAPLGIELDYGYVHSTSKIVKILNK